MKSIYTCQSEIDAIFYGERTALDFASKNSDLFSTIIDSTEHQIEEVLGTVQPKVVLSSMEPEPIVEAKSMDDPPFTALVDSLFWYWRDGPSNESVAPNQTSKTSNNEALDFHELMLNTHEISDISYIQSFPSERTNGLSPDTHNSIKKVGPIIDTNHKGDGPPRLIVSFAGMLSPIVSVDQATMYANLILEELSDVFTEFDESGFRPLIVGNERVLSRIETTYETDFLGHDRYLEVLDSAPLLICPASIMSVFEATAYGVPVVLLPELSPSHWPDYHGLNEGINGTPFDGAILGEEIEELQDIPEAETDRLYDVLSAYRADQSAFDGAVDQIFRDVENQLLDLLHEENRTQLTESQRRAIESRLPSPDGAQEVATDLLSHI
jgi:hypothetical protein